MRRIVWLLACLLSLAARAQEVERIYVSTDRSVYIAGDDVWCSLFVIDAKTGRISPFSAVAYLELISTDGTASTAKIGLFEGRGAGKLHIPGGAPTGNYRLVAYTALNANEEETAGWGIGGKTLSVFNTASLSRVENGTVLENEADYLRHKTPAFPSKGEVKAYIKGIARTGNAFTLLLNNAGEAASVSVSVALEDDIIPPSQTGIAAFLQQVKEQPAPNFTGKRIPEYEGEIIYARADGEFATLSSAGSPSDVYVGLVGEKGQLLFFTNNIYGDRELVCEISSFEGGNHSITLEDSFIHPAVADIPPLALSRAQYGALVRRKAAWPAAREAETQLNYLPRRQDCLLEGMACQRYILDDYTRFPSLEEVLTEIVKELRIHTNHGERELQMLLVNGTSGQRSFQSNILVMLDGVVIRDLSLLENMDAYLLDKVDLYREGLSVGGVFYLGCVNFITKKNYVKLLPFPPTVRVVDFQGVSYPSAYLGAAAAGKDLRQLLYWHPLLDIPAGELLSIPLQAPSYQGRFRVTVEGLTTGGLPIREDYLFEVQ